MCGIYKLYSQSHSLTLEKAGAVGGFDNREIHVGYVNCIVIYKILLKQFYIRNISKFLTNRNNCNIKNDQLQSLMQTRFGWLLVPVL